MRRADLTEEAFAAATSAWDAPRARPRSGSIALFRSPLLDRFTRSPPWLPYVLVTPLAGAAAAIGLARGPSWPAALGALALGAGSWTLVEYTMHRFLFHARVESEAGRIATFLAHGHHHVFPNDRARIAATPIQIGSLLLLFWGVFSLALGALAPLAFAGAAVFYLLYEAAHYVAHFATPRSAVLCALKRHHLAHHHRDPRSRWGIGSPIWDVVFRTMGPAEPSARSDAGEGEGPPQTGDP